MCRVLMAAFLGFLPASGCRHSPQGFLGQESPCGPSGGFRILESGGTGSGLMNAEVTRTGVRRASLVLAAPVRARADIRCGSGAARFECLAAPVFNVGDGFDLSISLISRGAERQVFRRSFDAARNREDREWIPLEFPVTLTGTDDEEVEVRLSAGPRGDLVADWLALAEFRLTKNGAIP